MDIYATSVDYDAKKEQTKEFFKTVQNKMHYAVHWNTATEIIFDRVDSEKENIGLFLKEIFQQMQKQKLLKTIKKIKIEEYDKEGTKNEKIQSRNVWRKIHAIS